MTYKALYREWRPSTFDDMVEQHHVVQTLKNAVKSEQIAHAYLFCGTRGTGKTSCAHIMAKAVNCLDPEDGNPCNECDACKGISSGAISDVLEIDAASNNSVNNIRELREEVQYLPTAAKYKVYIIDEVHMLSTGAFNALLKTLEEPPSHVIFILATTEPHKLPATILSRCQRFDFRQISLSGIIDRMKLIIDEKNAQVEEDAVKIIARKADGAMRDALSLLDQCLSSGLQNIKQEDVIEMLGTVNDDEILSICNTMLSYDIGALFLEIDKIVSGGKKVSVLIDELIMFYRNMLIVMTVDQPETMLELSKDTLNKISEVSKLTTPEKVIFIISELSKLENQIKWVAMPKVILESGLVSICIDRPISSSNEVMETRLKNLEMKLDNFSALLSNNTLQPVTKISDDNLQSDDLNPVALDAPNESDEAEAETSTTEQPQNAEVDYDSPSAGKPRELSIWKNCMEEIFQQKKPLYFILQRTVAYEKDGTVVISGLDNNEYIKMQVTREDHVALIKQLISKKLGHNIKLKFNYIDTGKKAPKSGVIQKIKKISEEMDIPFDIK